MPTFYAFWFFFSAGWGYLLACFSESDAPSWGQLFGSFPLAFVTFLVLLGLELRRQALGHYASRASFKLKPWNRPIVRLQTVTCPRFLHSLLAVVLVGVGVLPLWARAEPIVRLAPSAFANLPSAVRNSLVRYGCAVPQSFLAKGPENAVAGSFTRRGAREWAVLCSVDGVSKILIFGARSQRPLTHLAASPDENYVQVIRDGLTGYSRRISAVPATTPGLTAIDDAFLEKGSTVWFRSGRVWRETPGAD